MSVDLVKNKFDIAAFNRDFENQMIAKKEEENKKDMEKLKEMNKEIYKKKISEMTTGEIIGEWQSSLTGMINDMIHLKFQPEILFSENRLFFIGITLLIIVILFYFLFWLFNPKDIVNTGHTVNVSFNLPPIEEESRNRLFNFFRKPKKF